MEFVSDLFMYAAVAILSSLPFLCVGIYFWLLVSGIL